MAPKTAAKAAPAAPDIQLPGLVIGPADINRLLSELEVTNEALLQRGLRKGDNGSKIPKVSQLMEQVLELNGLELTRPADRQSLARFLEEVQLQAPVLHMSFSADPSPDFLSKLMAWLRREIHPLALLSVGLQPTIGAGCVLRTTNRYFDFSLRQEFIKRQDLLKAKLTAGSERAKP
ncbi:MAG TPA: hypothetical protein VM535_01505 [Candidatus Saccharimonadales bacterium]|nr:hypothetical protein [Candidatus Saccharimonadales bacterium]